MSVATNSFIETGGFIGSTTRHVARLHPHLDIYSCEPDPVAFRELEKNTEAYASVQLYNVKSLRFLEHVVTRAKPPALYFLDAHGPYVDNSNCLVDEWPLLKELSIITSRVSSAVIIADDVCVPDSRDFRHWNAGFTIGPSELKGALATGRSYQIAYPAYDTDTEGQLPGYSVIAFGDEMLRWLSEDIDSILRGNS